MSIRSGRYIITNAQHWNLAFLSDNKDGTSLLGCLEQDVSGQEWNVKELRNGRYSIVNFGHKMWASASFPPQEGENVVGKESEWPWLLKEHEGGKYIITAANGEMCWWLDEIWPKTPITLRKTVPSNPRCQWTFQEIVRVETAPYEAAKNEAEMVKAELEQAKVELTRARAELVQTKADLEQVKAEVARKEREVKQVSRKTAQAKADATKEAAKWEALEAMDDNGDEVYDDGDEVYDNGDEVYDDDDGIMDIAPPLRPIEMPEDGATTSLRPGGHQNVVRSPSGQELWEKQRLDQPDTDEVPTVLGVIELSNKGSWQEVVKQGLKAIRIHSDLRHENQDGIPETELLQICTLAMHAHNELEAQGTCRKWCQDVFPLLQTLYDFKPEDFRDVLGVHLSDLCFSLSKEYKEKEAARRGSQSISLLRQCYESNPSKYHRLYIEALTRLASVCRYNDRKLSLQCLTTALPILEELCAISPKEHILQLAECLTSITSAVSSEEETIIYANKAIKAYERVCEEINNWNYRGNLAEVAGWAAAAYAHLLNYKMAVELGEKAIDSYRYSGSGDDDGSSATYWRKRVAAWKPHIRSEEEDPWKEQAKKLKSSYQSIGSQS